jgi:hypothetical protein
LKKIFDSFLFYKLVDGHSTELSTILEGLDYRFRLPVKAFKKHFEVVLTPLEEGEVRDGEPVDWKDLDRKKRLQQLATLPIGKAIDEILYSGDISKIAYIASRLSKYSQFLQNPDGQHNADHPSIERGLRRDVLYTAMIGTPEMAVYKIALRQCRDQNIGMSGSSSEPGRSPSHFPLLRGYHSGIHDGQIGDYGQLFDVYERAASQVKDRSPESSDDSVEFKAVRVAADWLTEAMKYNDPGRSRHSSYARPLEEALTWARLGDPHLKKQLVGMRQKIEGADLHMIRRFIGKSGTSEQQGRDRRRIQVLNEKLNLWGDEEVLAGTISKEVRRSTRRDDSEETKASATEEVLRVKLLQRAFGNQASRFLDWDGKRIDKERIISLVRDDADFLDDEARAELLRLNRALLRGVEDAKAELEKQFRIVALNYKDDLYGHGEQAKERAEEAYREVCEKYERAFTEAVPNVLFQQAKRIFVKQENELAARQLEERFFALASRDRRQEYEAAIASIEAGSLPEGEKRLQISRTTHQYHESILRSPEGLLMQREKQAILQRTPAGLWTDLRRERDRLEERYERKKSLGQKAVDLHWRYAKTPYGGTIDWINTAPFGSIERTHKALRLGVDEPTAFALGFGQRMFAGADMPHEVLDKLSGIVAVLPSRDLSRLEQSYSAQYGAVAANQEKVQSAKLKKKDEWTDKKTAFSKACVELRDEILNERDFQKLRTFGEAAGLNIDFRSPELYQAVVTAMHNALDRNNYQAWPEFRGAKEIIAGIGFNIIQESPELQEKVRFLIKDTLERGEIDNTRLLFGIANIRVDFSGDMVDAVRQCYARVTEQSQDGDITKKLEQIARVTSIQADFQESELRRSILARYIKWSMQGDAVYSRGGYRPSPKTLIADLESFTGVNRSLVLTTPDGWAALIESAANLNDYKKNVAFFNENQIKKGPDQEAKGELMREGLLKAYVRLIKDQKFPYISELMAEYGIAPPQASLREAAFSELATKGSLSDGLSALLLKCKTKLECSPEDVVRFSALNPSAWAILYTIGLPKDARAKKRVTSAAEGVSPLAAIMPDLLGVKGLGARPEFCPWRQQMDPLIRNISSTHSLETASNREGLVEFTRRFGMVNLPRLASVVIDLVSLRDRLQKREAEALDSLSVSTRNELAALWSSRKASFSWDTVKNPKDVEEILNHLESTLDSLRRDIVNDKVPDGLEESSLGMELFNSIIIRSGSYGSLEDRRSIILQWRATERSLGKAVTTVPAHYPKGAIKVPVKTQSGGSSLDQVASILEGASGSAEELEKRALATQKLESDKQNLLKQESLRNFVAPFQAEMDSVFQVNGVRSITLLERAVSRLTREIEEVEKNLLALGDVEPTEERQKLVYQKKKAGMEATLEKLREKKTALGSICLPENLESMLELAAKRSSDPESSTSLDLLRGALGSRKIEEVDQYLLVQAELEILVAQFGHELLQVAKPEVYFLILKLAALESPGHIEAIQREMRASQGGALSEAALAAWSDWFKQEALLHFTDPGNAHKTTRRVPFSKNLQKLIEKVLEITGQRPELLEGWNRGVYDKSIKHPLAAADLKTKDLNRKIEDIRSSGALESQKKTLETVDVNYYVCHGLGRIFAGDIASACYDKHRDALAKNEYPDIQAVLMTHEDKKSIEMFGSFLLIEGATTGGKKALIIRALNPTDSVIQRQLDANDLVQKTIEYAISIAKSGRKDMVLICDSHSGGHSSNREPVATAISASAARLGWPHGPELRSTKETNFNGYDIWKQGQTRLVWSV